MTDYYRTVHPDAWVMRRRKRKPPRKPAPATLARREKIQWLERVAAEDGEGCREWPWGLDHGGYATVSWQGRPKRVGHVVLTLSGRPRPGSLHMLHSCDNRRCAAPWHLRWGTNAENIADKVARAPMTPFRLAKYGEQA